MAFQFYNFDKTFTNIRKMLIKNNLTNFLIRLLVAFFFVPAILLKHIYNIKLYSDVQLYVAHAMSSILCSEQIISGPAH